MATLSIHERSWSVQLETLGVEAARDRINRLADNAADSRGFFDKVARILLADSRQRWTSNGYGWTPLDADTIRQKAKKGQSGGILRATGALEKALTVWRAPGQKVVFAPDHFIFGLQIGGPAFYGLFHQKGRGVPARVVQKVTQTTRRKVRQALLDHLMERG